MTGSDLSGLPGNSELFFPVDGLRDREELRAEHIEAVTSLW